jgi:hypothetical protein
LNTVNNYRRKRWLAAGFFLAILLLTIGPLTLLRSPAPAGYVNDIAVCEPEYNPGPAGIAQAEKNESYLEESDSLIQLLANSDDSDVSIFNSMGGLLTYDLNLVSRAPYRQQWPKREGVRVILLTNLVRFIDA